MTRLFFILLSIVLTTLSGIGIVIVLTMGLYDLRSILLAAAAGAILSLPATWLITRAIDRNIG